MATTLDLLLRKFRYFILLVCIFILLLYPFLHVLLFSQDIFLNQQYIESLDRQYGSASLLDRFYSLRSFYSFGLNAIFHSKTSKEAVNLSDPETVFQYVFDRTPYYAIVYPTERYYYYRFNSSEGEVSGNIRLVELDNGNLGVGYFLAENQERPGSKIFGKEEGLDVEKISEDLYKVSYRGKTIRFSISPIWDDEPVTRLLPQEKYLAQMRDESGMIFYLIFNEKENIFYYLLSDNFVPTDGFDSIGDFLIVGERTKFAFYSDPHFNRKILVGVSRDEISKNSYFDGPFDQTYPFIPIKEMAYKVYPYLQLSGIDLYGNFLNSASTRIAISPYLDYNSNEELLGMVEQCNSLAEDTDELWSCLTYEQKRDFHKDSPMFYQNGTLKLFPSNSST